jgi:hypothetical protein
MTAIDIFNGFGIYHSKNTGHIYYHADLRKNKLYWYNVNKYVYSNDIEKTLDNFKSELSKIKGGKA